MRVSLREFRLIVGIELLAEAGDISRLASRGVKDRGILVARSRFSNTILVVSMNDAKLLGAAHALTQPDGSWELRTLYADDAVSAVFLLGAALSIWKRVIADSTVSPAAQAVMKRYFDVNKDNPQLIEPSKIDIRDQAGPEFLSATYLGPLPGFDIERALANGTQAAENLGLSVDDLASELSSTSADEFVRIYRDPVRTKSSDNKEVMRELDRLNAALSAGDSSKIVSKLIDVMNGETDWLSDSPTIRFIEENYVALQVLAAADDGDLNMRRQWQRIFDWYEENKR